MNAGAGKKGIKSFPGQFWLVILFEFIERGSYYGMMSVLSVYLTDILFISKESVGLIKGTIQPILYFLPIISGALADRFGFRKTLTVAFALMGGGYFLTAQVSTYTPVFLALCFMALGAGTFKPIISGSIARLTTKEQSSMGFGIYYWSINFGAFLFPLILVPLLKKVPSTPEWKWVILAAAIGTGIMILPTMLFFKEPPKPKAAKDAKTTNLIQTLANAFEIIYSPFVLIFRLQKKTKSIVISIMSLLTLYGIMVYMKNSNFIVLFFSILFWSSQAILGLRSFGKKSESRSWLITVFFLGLMGIIWTLTGLSVFTKIVSSVIASTVLALFIIEIRELPKFRDHFQFLLLIAIYSGFWILYFQMFDSVLWYVKDFVDASSLNRMVNAYLMPLINYAGIGFVMGKNACILFLDQLFHWQIPVSGFKWFVWHFDVEHVTVINAGTIILLQLIISSIVKKTKALPTMMTGIAMGTIGMAILAINTSIWVFMAGIVIFSIGEMTAHPKFISYVGQTAPKERLATYMGYIFLYGVIGSSIGAPLGAKLYVHFVDNLGQPRILWIIFSGIGVVTLAGLAIFNRWTQTKSLSKAKQ